MDSSAQVTRLPSTIHIELLHLPSSYALRDNLLTQVNSPNTTSDLSEQDTQSPSTTRTAPRQAQSDAPSRDYVQNLKNETSTHPLVPTFQNPLHSTQLPLGSQTHPAAHFQPSLPTPLSHTTTNVTQQTATSLTTILTLYIFPPFHFQNHPHTTKNTLAHQPPPTSNLQTPSP